MKSFVFLCLQFLLCGIASSQNDESYDEPPFSIVSQHFFSDWSDRLQSLEETVRQQNQHLENLKNHCAFRTPDAGWYTPGNCFQYRRTPHRQNWQASRTACQVLGGDLAHVGIRNVAMRGLVVDALAGVTDLWLGINSPPGRRAYTFLDGVGSTDVNTAWHPRQPTGDGVCININFPTFVIRNRANDAPCSHSTYGLCEKPLN